MTNKTQLKTAACSALVFVIATGVTLASLDPAQAMSPRPKPKPPVVAIAPTHSLITELQNRTATRRLLTSNLKPRYWAHRGVFHQSTINSNFPTVEPLPENTFSSVLQARGYGLNAVEIDVRLSKDGVPMIAHDIVTGRYTNDDSYSGKYNPQWFIEKNLTLAQGNLLRSNTANDLTNLRLKSYGAGSKMTLTSEKIQTLQAFLNNARGVDTLIVLDLQDNAAVAAAAAAIKATGMQNRVALKFFAESAVPDQELNGRDISNLVSAQINNWGADLWYIIQFNDGQLTLQSRTGDATIFKYGSFIDPLVWSNYFRATGRLIGIGISQPTDVSKQEKLIALRRLSQYYESSDNAMPTIGFLINPDSSWVDSSGCKLYRFRANNDASGNVVTTPFSFDDIGEQGRRNFALARDYIIADILPQPEFINNILYRKATALQSEFTSTFCDTALNSNVIANPY